MLSYYNSVFRIITYFLLSVNQFAIFWDVSYAVLIVLMKTVCYIIILLHYESNATSNHVYCINPETMII